MTNTVNPTPFATPPRHLYIHWPFCSFKCHYCDFVAFQEHADYQEQYHRVLVNEVAAFARRYPTKPVIDTIFLGGGTPSLYPLPWITELFATLQQNYDLSTASEITIETNPADIDEEKLETWAGLGINRLSTGVQSLNDQVLLELNRRQRASDVHRVMRIAPKYFNNISIDLILGLPGVTEEAWHQTITQATQWPISHISVYFLTIHEKTPLYFKVARGQVTLPTDDRMVVLYEKTIENLAKAGINQYEISNFARSGRESIHNQAYWNRKPYKGFGIGASSFDGSGRFIATSNLETYLKISENDDWIAPCTTEILTRKQALLELLMLGLRQSKGIDLHDVVYLENMEEHARIQHNLPLLQEAGLLVYTPERIWLTPKGMALENEVIMRLL